MAVSRMVVVGLSGATSDLLVPWAREGALPSLARMFVHGGLGGRLATAALDDRDLAAHPVASIGRDAAEVGERARGSLASTLQGIGYP